MCASMRDRTKAPSGARIALFDKCVLFVAILLLGLSVAGRLTLLSGLYKAGFFAACLLLVAVLITVLRTGLQSHRISLASSVLLALVTAVAWSAPPSPPPTSPPCKLRGVLLVDDRRWKSGGTIAWLTYPASTVGLDENGAFCFPGSPPETDPVKFELSLRAGDGKEYLATTLFNPSNGPELSVAGRDLTDLPPRYKWIRGAIYVDGRPSTESLTVRVEDAVYLDTPAIPAARDIEPRESGLFRFAVIGVSNQAKLRIDRVGGRCTVWPPLVEKDGTYPIRIQRSEFFECHSESPRCPSRPWSIGSDGTFRMGEHLWRGGFGERGLAEIPALLQAENRRLADATTPWTLPSGDQLKDLCCLIATVPELADAAGKPIWSSRPGRNSGWVARCDGEGSRSDLQERLDRVPAQVFLVRPALPGG